MSVSRVASVCLRSAGRRIGRPVLRLSCRNFCAEIKGRNLWGSDAEERISKVPVIEIAGTVAVCEGGSGGLGHPVQYIQLDRVNPEPAVCKYCGLRYKMGKRLNRFGKEKLFEAPITAPQSA